MTQEQHPITPPDELVMEWIKKHYGCRVHRDLGGVERTIATQSARWGADQELEASVVWLIGNQNPRWAAALQEARRPKPPSLKGQALSALYDVTSCADDTGEFYQQNIEIIRTALEALPD